MLTNHCRQNDAFCFIEGYAIIFQIAFLPFGLLIDKWRWDVFSGAVNETQWNDHWWYYRKEIQKVKPPVTRTAEDFDPGAKYHVPGDSQYISTETWSRDELLSQSQDFHLVSVNCSTKVQLISTLSVLPEMFVTGEPRKSRKRPSKNSAHAHLTTHALYSQKQEDSLVGLSVELNTTSALANYATEECPQVEDKVICGPHLTVSVLQSRVYVPGTLWPTSYSFSIHKAVSMFQVLCGPHLTVSVQQSRVYVPGTLWPISYSFSSTKPCLCSRYFVAHILQFQFHKALCIAAGQYDPTDPNTRPLHKCDIYNSTAAGQKLRYIFL
uniref:Angiotensin-converting enzyme n=1 Tax=Timema shepardi TaxID=629360 RepID=A0A7R9AMT8_TIMSH|nr:unnamed protein product [Timema shepardi]